MSKSWKNKVLSPTLPWSKYTKNCLLTVCDLGLLKSCLYAGVSGFIATVFFLSAFKGIF